MTPNELLRLLGLAWSRLVIYPGGLAVFAVIWLVTRSQKPVQPRVRSPEAGDWGPEITESRIERLFWKTNNGSWFLVLSSTVLPWLGLALLPLPAATPMSRTTDIIIVLALLEWPRLTTIAHELRSAGQADQRAGARRLAAALNSYPTLMLATLALAQPAGSFDIAALALPPGETSSLNLQVLHWLGAAAWTFALAPLLGLGPFQACAPADHHRRVPINGWGVGMWIRGCGLVSIAALPWLAPFGALAEQGGYSVATLLAIAFVPFTLGGLIWWYDRRTAHQSARRWAWAYVALDCVLLVALLWAAYAAIPSS